MGGRIEMMVLTWFRRCLSLALLMAALAIGGCSDSDGGRAVDSRLTDSESGCLTCHTDDGTLKQLAQEPEDGPEDSGEG